jgi:hypothetical protein
MSLLLRSRQTISIYLVDEIASKSSGGETAVILGYSIKKLQFQVSNKRGLPATKGTRPRGQPQDQRHSGS